MNRGTPARDGRRVEFPADLSVPVSDAVSLHIRHWPGQAAGGRPFLLLHGLLSNARMWDEVAVRLVAEGHRVYAVDQRGHGESSAPEDGYDQATAVSDLAMAAAALGLTGALVAGHSWGGHLALRLAVEHPTLVAGLALVDGGWYEFDGPAMESLWARTAEVVRSAQHGTTVAQLRDYLRCVHPRWSPAAIEAKLADYRVGPGELLLPRLSEAQVMSIVRSLRQDPPGPWLPQVAVPVVLLPILPTAHPQWAEQVRTWVADAEAALPRATVRWYPGGDHDLHADVPDEVANDLLQLARGSRPDS